MTAYRLMGVLIPASFARSADDGTGFIEADTDQPVQRWRTETAKSPTGNPRCRCSHAQTTHQNGAGECWSAACGCSFFRPKSETRTA